MKKNDMKELGLLNNEELKALKLSKTSKSCLAFCP